MHVAHLPWIPVLTDGHPERLGLREVLVRAHTITSLGELSAIERSALTRLLTAFAALVARAGGVDGERFTEKGVDAVLAEHDHLLRLNDPERPFLQEWFVTDDGEGGPLDLIAPGAPGASSKAWRLRSRNTGHWLEKTDIGSAAVILAARWYHGFGGNAKSLHPFTAGNGTIGGRAGDDLTFFWRGTTLARTLLANTPQSWVRGAGLPGFLDREATTHGPAGAPHPLWINHACFLGTLVTWDGDQITGVRTSGTKHTAPGYLPTDAPAAKKDYLDRLRAQDEARVWVERDGKRVLFTRIKAHSAALVNLREWYQGLGAKALSGSRVRADGVLPADIGDGQWTLEMFAGFAPGSTAINYKEADWFAYDPATLDFDDDQATALVTSTGQILDVLRAVTGAGRVLFGEDDRKAATARGKFTRDVEKQFYRLASANLRDVVASAQQGRELDEQIAQSIVRHAHTALNECTRPLMTSGMAVKVIVASAAAQRSLARCKVSENA